MQWEGLTNIFDREEGKNRLLYNHSNGNWRSGSFHGQNYDWSHDIQGKEYCIQMF